MRKSLEETWSFLDDDDLEMPRLPDGRPFVPEAMPSHDDEELGFSYFKIVQENADLSNLTLPRTFFGRSELVRVSFANTDLSESRMCWNDFVDCDFRGADLSGCDMRASVFERCHFAAAVLRNADLRGSSFEGCDFSGADLLGAVAVDERGADSLRDRLSEEQQQGVTWAPDPGAEPPGG